MATKIPLPKWVKEKHLTVFVEGGYVFVDCFKKSKSSKTGEHFTRLYSIGIIVPEETEEKDVKYSLDGNVLTVTTKGE
jgi:viroplasmin and RNaseH domain-containing protein